MSVARTLSALCLIALVAVAYGQGATNSRSDRISQAISASEDAIQQAVSGRSTASSATTKSKDFASLATRDATKPSDFGRRLRSGATNSRSDRITQALSASADSIGLAVTSNSNVQAAAQKSKAFATLATRESTKASDFGRRLQSGATNSRSDRITQALSASADSIGLAVTGNSNVQTAAQKSKAFATLATRESTKASDFGRKLFSGATNSRSDRITQALSASADSIGLAVIGNSNVQAAAQKSKAFATLATRENSKASDFGRKLFSGATNSRSDRITQALSASADSIGLAVAGNSNVQAAAQKSKAFATLATRENTRASDFGH